jgi:hypothetical protein
VSGRKQKNRPRNTSKSIRQPLLQAIELQKNVQSGLLKPIKINDPLLKIVKKRSIGINFAELSTAKIIHAKTRTLTERKNNQIFIGPKIDGKHVILVEVASGKVEDWQPPSRI